MENRTRLLLIEPDERSAEQIRGCFTADSFEIQTCRSLASAKKEIPEFDPQLLLMEPELPDGEGLQLCKLLRERSDVPIVICSRRDQPYDQVLALDLGADDYVVKPFHPEVLQARVRRLLRRCYPVLQNANPGDRCVQYEQLSINLTNYQVMYQNRIIEMPPKELELLYFLAASPNQVFTREQLLDHIWGYDYEGDTRTVDVHIKRLREKLPEQEAWTLATVWGVGYKFECR